MDDLQFDDLFYDQDDELTKQLIEDYYDDLSSDSSFESLLNSSYDF